MEVLRRQLGATFTAFDDGTSHAMVDGLFLLPDGTRGALEVTTLTGSRAMEFEALTLGADWSSKVAGVSWFWAIWVTEDLDLNAMERHLGVVLQACEAANVHELEVGQWLGDTASHEWVRAQPGIRHGYGSDSGKFPGLVQLIPGDTHGAFLPEDAASNLTEWIESELMSPALARKLAKLEATGRPERHLWVRVHESAPPDVVLHALCFSDQVPTRPLVPSCGLTGLWIGPRWGNTLRWLQSEGWTRFELERG